MGDLLHWCKPGRGQWCRMKYQPPYNPQSHVRYQAIIDKGYIRQKSGIKSYNKTLFTIQESNTNLPREVCWQCMRLSCRLQLPVQMVYNGGSHLFPAGLTLQYTRLRQKQSKHKGHKSAVIDLCSPWQDFVWRGTQTGWPWKGRETGLW